MDIVPCSWLKGECSIYWPPYKTTARLRNAVKKMEPPSVETWSLEKINRVLYSNEDYDKLRRKLKEAEDTSDLKTSEELKKRKRKPIRKMYASSEESENDGDADADSDNGSDEECRQSKSKRPALESRPRPPSRLQTEAFHEMSRVRRPVTPGPSEIPSQQALNIGPNAGTQILNIVESVKEENRVVKQLLQRLYARSFVEDQPVQLPSELTIPIRTVEEMEDFEELLKDQTKMMSVVRFLSLFGGVDVRESVDCILRETLSNQLARQYDLKGLKGKRKFGDLQLLTVLYMCVQRNVSTRKATRKDVETEVSKWLVGVRYHI